MHISSGLRERSPTEAMRLVKIEGNPYEMGVSFGRQTSEILRTKLNRMLKGGNLAYATADGKTHFTSFNEAACVARKFRTAVEAKFPEIIDYMRGIAFGARIKEKELETVAFGYIPTTECSAFVIKGRASLEKRTLVAKNADNPYPTKDDDVILVFAKPKDGFSFVGFGAFPELPGYFEGMNERGLTIAGAGVRVKDGYSSYVRGGNVGAPVPILQTVAYWHSEDVDDALEYLRMVPRGFRGRNLLITDRHDCVVKAELSFESTNIMNPLVDDGFAAATNHFSSPKMSSLNEAGRSSKLRLRRLTKLLRQNYGRIDIERAQCILKDHANGPGNCSICRHGRSKTNGAIIFHPKERRFWVTSGNPCENEFQAFRMPQTAS